MKRLGDGAHPFTLSLSSYAPPSVQLVPAKRYYGAPIGTSYDVRCFIGESCEPRNNGAFTRGNRKLRQSGRGALTKYYGTF